MDGWYSREDAIEGDRGLARALRESGRARPLAFRRDVHCSRRSSSGSCRGSPSSCRSRAPAHLRIVPAFAGWEDPGAAFTAVTQLGTMAAVAHLLPRGPAADRARLAREPARPRAADASSTRGSAGTSCSARSRSGSSACCSRTRSRRGARDLYLIGVDADRARPDPAAGRAGGQARARASSEVKTRDGFWVGLAQALGAGPGRVALGGDDHRRAVPRAWTARRRRASRSCCRCRPSC